MGQTRSAAGEEAWARPGTSGLSNTPASLKLDVDCEQWLFCTLPLLPLLMPLQVLGWSHYSSEAKRQAGLPSTPFQSKFCHKA